MEIQTFQKWKKKMEIIHFSHYHPLILVETWRIKVPNCNCCCEEMSFPGYVCKSKMQKGYQDFPFDCEFYLHKSCAELAQEISHPLHDHTLTLLSEMPGFLLFWDIIICDGCRYLYNKGFTYYCSWCRFNLHPKCTPEVQDHQELLQQQTFNKEVAQLYHFCHKQHALNFCNLRESDEKDCCCCKQRISGSAYCCLQCKFFIHESCKEIPKQVQHPFHPQHLLLAQSIDKHTSFDCRCKACRSSIYGFRISCNMCNFHLHVSCANPNRYALKHKCHEHNMYYFLDNFTTEYFICDYFTREYFNCNKCHEKCLDDEAFYCCVECDFNLHLKCIPIPSVVMITQKHLHPLTLIDSVKDDNPLIQYLMDSNDKLDYSMDYYCDICEKPGNPKHHAYCCTECIYIAHVECIISEDNTPPEIPSNMNITHGTEQKMSDEADHITELQAEGSMSKKNGASTSLDSKCKDNEQLFSHPTHPHHKLTFVFEEKIKDCNGCLEVMCFPGYACHECEFYLHKSCAELPTKILHPLHPHPLTCSLTEEALICDGCRDLYNSGFNFWCSWCRFNLDVKCASKQHQERHQTFKELTIYRFYHKHALKLCNVIKIDDKYCRCCNQSISGSAYCCLQCKFFIHESCKEIPEQVQHPFHPRHLLLAQVMIDEPQPLRYMYWPPNRCKACLKKIDGIKIGCITCSFNLHVSCANPNYRALEHMCHIHNMYYFVNDDTTGYLKCKKCHEICFGEAFYRCVHCNINLHLECIPIPSAVIVIQKHHHPLTLIDSVKEDNPLIQYLMDSNDKVDHSMDYYCDICETPGNPKHHAYCCTECNYIAHVECIISKEEILECSVPRRRYVEYWGPYEEVDESE